MSSDDFQNGRHTSTTLGESALFDALAVAESDVFPEIDASTVVPFIADDSTVDDQRTGRDTITGRFAAGNRYGGNSLAGRQARNRHALARASKPEDTVAVYMTLIEIAKDKKQPGAVRVAAAKAALDRQLGPPVSLDIYEALSELENTVLKRKVSSR